MSQNPSFPTTPIPHSTSLTPDLDGGHLVHNEPFPLTAPEHTPEKPRRARKPPNRYSPSPQERSRRQSKARHAPKTRTPDKAKNDSRTEVSGRTRGTPVAAPFTVPEEDSTDDEFEIIVEQI